MKKLQKTIALVLIVLLISACRNDIQRSRSIEEPGVYSALINEQLEVPFGYLMGDAPIIIVSSSYYEAVEDDYLYEGAPSLDKDTLEDFKIVNQVSEILDTALSVNKPYEYVVLPSDENGWVEFEQKYPNVITITTLSKIGFDKELNQALVYMAYYCGSECGTANIYFLVRKGDTWKVESTIKVWDS